MNRLALKMSAEWKELWDRFLPGEVKMDNFGPLEEKYSDILLKSALDLNNPWPPIDFKSCTIDQQLWVRRLAFFASKSAEAQMYDRMLEIYNDKDVAEAMSEKAQS